MGWSVLLLGLLLRNGEVGLGDSQCSCDVDRTWREGGRGVGALCWFLGLCCSFTRRCRRFLGSL